MAAFRGMHVSPAVAKRDYQESVTTRQTHGQTDRNGQTLDKVIPMCHLVMVHNPAHDLFSIGHFLCRVRVVDCCDLRNGAERQ